jgi:hypothetical protein
MTSTSNRAHADLTRSPLTFRDVSADIVVTLNIFVTGHIERERDRNLLVRGDSP